MTLNDVSNLDEAEEDILTYTVSDEAIEAAAGIEIGGLSDTVWLASHRGPPWLPWLSGPRGGDPS